MAISKNGIYGAQHGKLGNIVYYTLNGTPVSRTIGQNTKPPTIRQLDSRKRTGMTSSMLKPIKEFIELGFLDTTPNISTNAYNRAVGDNVNIIIEGSYPDLYINFEKILVSNGDLKPAEEPTVVQVAEGLRFSWLTYPRMAWPESSDQVMMLAYFPQTKEAVYSLFGVGRIVGTDILELSEAFKDRYMETYISFISTDRRHVAPSIYTGHFNK